MVQVNPLIVRGLSSGKAVSYYSDKCNVLHEASQINISGYLDLSISSQIESY